MSTLTPRQQEILRLKDQLTISLLKENQRSEDYMDQVELQAAIKGLENASDLDHVRVFQCGSCREILSYERSKRSSYCHVCSEVYAEIFGREPE